MAKASVPKTKTVSALFKELKVAATHHKLKGMTRAGRECTVQQLRDMTAKQLDDEFLAPLPAQEKEDGATLEGTVKTFLMDLLGIDKESLKRDRSDGTDSEVAAAQPSAPQGRTEDSSSPKRTTPASKQDSAAQRHEDSAIAEAVASRTMTDKAVTLVEDSVGSPTEPKLSTAALNFYHAHASFKEAAADGELRAMYSSLKSLFAALGWKDSWVAVKTLAEKTTGHDKAVVIPNGGRTEFRIGVILHGIGRAKASLDFQKEGTPEVPTALDWSKTASEAVLFMARALHFVQDDRMKDAVDRALESVRPKVHVETVVRKAFPNNIADCLVTAYLRHPEESAVHATPASSQAQTQVVKVELDSSKLTTTISKAVDDALKAGLSSRAPVPPPLPASTGETSVPLRGMAAITCNKCKQQGHKKAQCPLRAAK